jgi:glycosyltransferase involved in cell wall biosynthesis
MKNLLIITKTVDQDDQLLGFFLGWVRGFANTFGRVSILCLERGKFNLPENVSVISLGKDRGFSKIFQLFNFYMNCWSLRKQYDVVFVHMNAIWVVVGTWLWHLMGKKVFLWYAHKTIKLKHKVAEKLADGIFASTPQGFRIESKKLMIVGQGIDTELFRPDFYKRPARLGILSVGRLARVKNYDALIDTVKILNNTDLNFHITVIGESVLNEDKKYEKEIKDTIKKLGIEDRFSFLGKIANRNLPQYYQANHIYVNLSKTGSLDKTIVEAMASGCTVLSSNDSAKEFLPDELIVDGDNPKELAEKIKEMTQKDFSNKLRDYVVRNHSLGGLIRRISERMC